MSNEKIYGNLKFFKFDKGYGFITVLGENRDVFVHAKDLKNSGIPVVESDLPNGTPFVFEEIDNNGRSMASNLEIDNGQVD